jgi:glycosyltransferase 2 family protein
VRIKILKIILKILVSLAFVAWLVFKINWIEVLEYLKKINLIYIILYFVVILAGIAISSRKWQHLVRAKGISLDFNESFKLYFTGTFINNFMPSIVGSDAFRTYQVGKREGKYTEAASTVVMDRITGLVAAMIMSIAFAIINIKNTMALPLLYISNIIIISSFSIDLVIYQIRKYEKGKSFIKKFLPAKILYFFRQIGEYNNNKKVIKKTILLGIAFDFIGIALANYILFFSLGIHIGLLSYLSVIFIISIISSLPISINNIGLKEWSYVAFFGLFGLNASAVTTVAILSRFLQMLLSFAALPLYFKLKK